MFAITSTPRVAVIIPAWNEEGSIGRVIDDLPEAWVQRVIVADNNSTDYTADVARNWALQREFTPAMPAAERERRCRRWEEAVRRSLGWETST